MWVASECFKEKFNAGCRLLWCYERKNGEKDLRQERIAFFPSSFHLIQPCLCLLIQHTRIKIWVTSHSILPGINYTGLWCRSIAHLNLSCSFIISNENHISPIIFNRSSFFLTNNKKNIDPSLLRHDLHTQTRGTYERITRWNENKLFFGVVK